MPDDPIDFDDAVERIEDWISTSTGGLERLPPAALSRARRSSVEGWRVSIPCTDGPRRLDIVIGESFPFVPPQIVLVDRPPFLTWPHVEEDGRLCLATETVTYSPGDPVGVLVTLLDLAVRLIERCEGGDVDDDFRSEVLSYWRNVADYPGPPIVTACDADGPSRIIRVWWGKDYALLGDGDDEILAWLRNRYGRLKLKPRETKTAPAVFIKLGRCLLPAEYPKSAADIHALAREAGASDLLDQALASLPDKLAVALCMATDNGTAVAGIVIPRPIPQRGVDRLTKGYSGGRSIPVDVLSPRFFGPNPAKKASLERVDAAWIHGRCQDDRFPALRGSKVVVLGCGSVGAPIAVSLAQAGVGTLVLVDDDLLVGANVGRHPLGLGSLRHGKAADLKLRIAADLPHVRVEAMKCRAEDVILGPPVVLDDASLIVSALGNWSAERLLDEWHRAEGRHVPILYTWTEPRATAGHALTVVGSASSLQQRVDETGLPRIQVTEWPAGDTKRQEPACGAMYEPYGPVELGFITAMAAELALDSLLGTTTSPTHKIWACSKRFLDRAGGSWTPLWKALPGFRNEGAFVTELPWSEAISLHAKAA
ncbi:E2/UBC family protein [Lichenihabitans psoromatis]|uniref:E2/UBC family protein n=1 Tax=Lichenihabitans psoromatis TaxID=2528642 RepID=UPI0013F157DC|nr:E2/UBC family protein [Lichenihabitans psoromatis]